MFKLSNKETWMIRDFGMSADFQEQFTKRKEELKIEANFQRIKTVKMFFANNLGTSSYLQQQTFADILQNMPS